MVLRFKKVVEDIWNKDSTYKSILSLTSLVMKKFVVGI